MKSYTGTAQPLRLRSIAACSPVTPRGSSAVPHLAGPRSDTADVAVDVKTTKIGTRDHTVHVQYRIGLPPDGVGRQRLRKNGYDRYLDSIAGHGLAVITRSAAVGAGVPDRAPRRPPSYVRGQGTRWRAEVKIRTPRSHNMRLGMDQRYMPAGVRHVTTWPRIDHGWHDRETDVGSAFGAGSHTEAQH